MHRVSLQGTLVENTVLVWSVFLDPCDSEGTEIMTGISDRIAKLRAVLSILERVRYILQVKQSKANFIIQSCMV